MVHVYTHACTHAHTYTAGDGFLFQPAEKKCLLTYLLACLGDGFLFQPAEKKCFRKASIEPSLCSKDAGFELYVRSDPYRPPSAPAVEVTVRHMCMHAVRMYALCVVQVQGGLLSTHACMHCVWCRYRAAC